MESPAKIRSSATAFNPRNPEALTGGSSSGACASIQEGSAVAAIGTDTGGSVRVPAALCGLAGYRSTIGRGDWRGGAHLAESFDTMGWLFRDLQDAPFLDAPFAPHETAPTSRFSRFAFVSGSFLHDCEPRVSECFRAVIRELEALGLEAHSIDPTWWADAVEIFAPIQASEAARLHAGNFRSLRACDPGPPEMGCQFQARRSCRAATTPRRLPRADGRALRGRLSRLAAVRARSLPSGRCRSFANTQPIAALHCALQPRRSSHNCDPVRARRNAACRGAR